MDAEEGAPRRFITPIWLGRRRYEPVHAFMRALAEARHVKRTGGSLLLIEPEPVIYICRLSQR